MKKHLLSSVIVAVIFGGAGFAGGWLLKTHNTSQAANGYSTGTSYYYKRHNNINAKSHLVVAVLSVTPSSLTVKLPNGNTEVVYVSGSTKYTLQTPATSSNVSQGQSIIVSGSNNSDGSVTANNITIK